MSDAPRTGAHRRFYYDCACGELVLEGARDFSRLDEPMPCCGAVGKARTLWPRFGRSPLERASAIDTTTPEGARAACLFLAASLEALMEEHLWFLLARFETHPVVILAMLSASEGRARMLTLFKRLTGVTTYAALDAHGLGDWHRRWDQLVSARNNLAHGGWYPHENGKSLDLHQLVDEVSVRSLEAMATLRNEGFSHVKARVQELQDFRSS